MPRAAGGALTASHIRVASAAGAKRRPSGYTRLGESIALGY
jgi:hypothetical protein